MNVSPSPGSGIGRHLAARSASSRSLEGGQLKISSALPHAPILLAELQAFRASIGESGHAKFEAAAGVHDDLVLAVALALWRLQSPTRQAAA